MVELDLGRCYGCGACAVRCPVQAITMEADERGFRKPVIAPDKCISCGLCERECIVGREEGLKTPYLRICGAKHIEEKVRLASSSGGVFSALADYILGLGGSVYGVVCEGGEIRHVRIAAREALPPLRGSKYVQSRLDTALYEALAADLTEGRAVLFTGTPCQCAGVRHFVRRPGISDERLFLADLICHGVTSPRLFADYIADCEKKAKKQIETHIFRSKEHEWGTHHEKNIFTDGTSDGESEQSQLFKTLFYSNLLLNEACFACGFADKKRVSDLSMADFWGIRQYHADRFDPTGVSTVLVNTPKGQTLLDSVRTLTFFEAELKDLRQKSLNRATEKPGGYESFWRAYRRGGFDAAMRNFRRKKRMKRLAVILAKPFPRTYRQRLKKQMKW